MTNEILTEENKYKLEFLDNDKNFDTRKDPGNKKY